VVSEAVVRRHFCLDDRSDDPHGAIRQPLGSVAELRGEPVGRSHAVVACSVVPPIMGLGNISTSLYVFIQLFRLRPDERAESILRRQPA